MKKRNVIHPKFLATDSEVEGEILGAFAGDGSICEKADYSVAFYFGLDELFYAQDFSFLLASFFNKKPYFYSRESKNEIFLRYRSKRICSFIRHYLNLGKRKTYDMHLRTLDHSVAFVKGFLRGCLDSDGFVDFKIKRISFAGVSGNLMRQIYALLSQIGFEPQFYTNKSKNKADLHFVKINKKHFDRFISFISPRNKKRSGAGGTFGRRLSNPR